MFRKLSEKGAAQQEGSHGHYLKQSLPSRISTRGPVTAFRAFRYASVVRACPQCCTVCSQAAHRWRPPARADLSQAMPITPGAMNGHVGSIIDGSGTSQEEFRLTSLRVADHTDEGPGGDSQKPVVNDNVLYHSLLGLARGERFGHLLALRGLLNSLACREPDADNLNETAWRRHRSNHGLLLQATGGNMAQTVAGLMWKRIW